MATSMWRTLACSWYAPPGRRYYSLILLMAVILLLPHLATALRTHREHKVHNIVLYPDKHSWCKTTPIKQVVAWPGCVAREIDNNVCVGACFSYTIPQTQPSAPGDVISPYCDSCQPSEVTWQEVSLECTNEEQGGDTFAIETPESITPGTSIVNSTSPPFLMQKKVQVIANCSCGACSHSHGHAHASGHGHGGHDGDEVLQQPALDVPELIGLTRQGQGPTRKLSANQSVAVAAAVAALLPALMLQHPHLKNAVEGSQLPPSLAEAAVEEMTMTSEHHHQEHHHQEHHHQEHHDPEVPSEHHHHHQQSSPQPELYKDEELSAAVTLPSEERSTPPEPLHVPPSDSPPLPSPVHHSGHHGHGHHPHNGHHGHLHGHHQTRHHGDGAPPAHLAVPHEKLQPAQEGAETSYQDNLVPSERVTNKEEEF